MFTDDQQHNEGSINSITCDKTAKNGYETHSFAWNRQTVPNGVINAVLHLVFMEFIIVIILNKSFRCV